MDVMRSLPYPPGDHLNEAPFRYSDSLRERNIRLLDLKFGHADELICFDIKTYELNAHPPYIALSYTWGNPKDTVNVLCGGKIIAVTRSLEGALGQLREGRKRLVREKFPRLRDSQALRFWIDAVCINQTDNKEKSFQVGMMPEIYQRASYVIAWLGPADQGSDLAIDCLNTVGKMAEACGMQDGYDVIHEIWHDMLFVPGAYERLISTTVTIENGDGSSFGVPGLILVLMFSLIGGWANDSNLLPTIELEEFFTRAWWSRIWVLQEIGLARDTEFLCGAQKISRTRCNAFINMYAALWIILGRMFQRDQSSLNQYQLRLIRKLFHHRPNLMLSMPRVYHEGTFPLAALLRATCVGSINLNRHGPHHLESTKPEDKIFALLGLASDRSELQALGVVPNYEISYEQTYATTMATLLRQGHFSMLSMCQGSKSSRLPSWVPDWSQSVTDMLQDVHNDHMTLDPPFGASSCMRQCSTIEILGDIGTVQRISVSGYLYDEIYQIGHFADRTDSKEVPIEETLTWPVQWLIEILRLSYCGRNRYTEFHQRLRASARTSIGDVGWDQHGKYARVGDLRVADATVLLRDGLHLIKKAQFRNEARRFIISQATKETTTHRIRNELRLGLEIMGKSLGRIPFVTKNGHLGLSSDRVARGDRVAIISGCQVPFILRYQSGQQYSIVGEAYVDGIMDGEAVRSSGWNSIILV